MDPSSTALSFAEGRVLLPFWIALATGLLGVCAGFLARPWPRRGRRVLLIGMTVAVWALALGYLLVERRLVIDPEAQQVSEGHEVFGVGPRRTWAFKDIAAVVLTRAPDESLHLSLEAGGEQIAVQTYGDVLQAEQEALALAGFGGWKALRRGYRLDRDAEAGKPQKFETAQGKRGVAFNFAPVVRVIEAVGAESVITP